MFQKGNKTPRNQGLRLGGSEGENISKMKQDTNKSRAKIVHKWSWEYLKNETRPQEIRGQAFMDAKPKMFQKGSKTPRNQGLSVCGSEAENV
jgi:hypothetical protein